MYLKNKAFRLDLWNFVLSSKLSCSKANKELCHTGSMNIHAQQTISMGFSKYRRSHTIIFLIIPMNEKSVSISVYLENKTTIIRLSPCVHITFWTVTFRFLWMLTSYVTGGCCHISVVWGCYGFPLKAETAELDILITWQGDNLITVYDVVEPSMHGRTSSWIDWFRIVLPWSNLIIELIFPVGKMGQLGKKNSVLCVTSFRFSFYQINNTYLIQTVLNTWEELNTTSHIVGCIT